MMGSSMFPEREIWIGRSHITGTTGSWVDLRNITGNVGSFFINTPPGLAAAYTVTFETAEADSANECNADAATATAMQQGYPSAALTTTISPTDANYSATLGGVCRVVLNCRGNFVRAKLSAATAGVTVDIIGKAARLAQI